MLRARQPVHAQSKSLLWLERMGKFRPWLYVVVLETVAVNEGSS